MPAQLTSPCRWPKALSARSTAALASFAGDVGEREAGRCAKLDGQGFAGCAIQVGDDDGSPSAASMRAVAAPRPDAAPVTRKT